ncbi:hypothetical protein CEV31_4060 [Brucella thiophenivorans]|uniref:Uncharacterized protein n=1 Tax=Brucella thiophenivorans TaxID=571255 RepID=A0A256EZB6_9HYPH|nr:hypothetical protein CEV31_4060 [Brucella thiophenivorans]
MSEALHHEGGTTRASAFFISYVEKRVRIFHGCKSIFILFTFCGR